MFTHRSFLAGVTLLCLAATIHADRRVYLDSVTVNSDGQTAVFPLYRGTSGGKDIYFVITESSDGGHADDIGVNRADKLEALKGTGASQQTTDNGGVIDFPHTVASFGAARITPNPTTGFPPLQAEPGSLGEEGYTPFAVLANGTVINAPHIAVATADGMIKHPKVVDIDPVANTVSLLLSDGLGRGNAVKYLSTDASAPDAAALEGAVFAPAMNQAPNDARAPLVAFVNGQVGANNPERQGLNSALLDGMSPLNIISYLPQQGAYSPLWDVFPARWTDQVVARGRNTRQDHTSDVEDLAEEGKVTNPAGGPYGPGGFIVNCPTITRED